MKYYCCFLLLILLISCGCTRSSKSTRFTLDTILPKHELNPKWDTRALSASEQELVKNALSQTYHYLGRGGQCYAFISETEEFVIKFPKQHIYKIPPYLNQLPIPYLLDRYKEKKRIKRQAKQDKDFSSYRIAFEELEEITGVLFVHLNSTDDLKEPLTLFDESGLRYQIDLNHMDFIVQKKADLIYPTVKKLLETEQIEQIKAIIHQIVQLISTRCQLGFEDRDPNLRTNCGLLFDRAIKIDIGRLIPDPEMKEPQRMRAELVRIITPFQEWIKMHNASLADYCNEAIEEVLKKQPLPL